MDGKGSCRDGDSPALTPHSRNALCIRIAKTEAFLSQPRDYGKPWFGQLMAGPQMIAYFLQINDWMERYGIG